ncbi:MAG: hypothetical protein H0X25_05145 [Acidobacteriales bacterium]|nr:hypothetical protein [Terriglobales bacterium]
MSVKRATFVCLVLLFFALHLSTAQQAPAVSPGASAPVQTMDADRAKIDEVFKSYESAYNHKNLEALLALYPSLRTQEKDYEKAQWHLAEDPNVFSEQMTLDAVEVQVNGNQATARARRTEQYVTLETRSEITSGDLNMYNMPAQAPSPVPQTKKKVSKKTDVIVMNLQRNGDTWQIASLTVDKKAR